MNHLHFTDSIIELSQDTEKKAVYVDADEGGEDTLGDEAESKTTSTGLDFARSETNLRSANCENINL